MNTFLLLLIKLLPYYFVIFLGYGIAKRFKINLEIISRFYIFVFLSPVVFYGVLKTPLFSGGMLIPAIFFFVSTLISIIFLFIGKSLWKDATANLLSFTSGTGNVGNFGVTLSISLLGLAATAPAIMVNVGVILYIQTIGFFIASKGKYSIKQSIINLAKLAPLYAFFIGIIAQVFAVHLTNTLNDFFTKFISFYNIIGFLLVGFGLAKITKESMDKLYIMLSLFSKFIVWPMVIAIIVFFDRNFFHLLNQLTYNVMLIQSITPIALFVISYSAVLKLYPEKASFAVFVSTIFSLFYIPLIVAIFIK